MEAEHQPGTMEQWYERAIVLYWNWRESRREEERLKGRREQEGQLQDNRSRDRQCHDH